MQVTEKVVSHVPDFFTVIKGDTGAKRNVVDSCKVSHPFEIHLANSIYDRFNKSVIKSTCHSGMLYLYYEDHSRSV